MPDNRFSGIRRRAGLCGVLLLVATVTQSFSLALAAETKPWAEKAIREHVDASRFSGTLSEEQLDELVRRGEDLFKASFTTADGVGRPMTTQAIIPTKRKRPSALGFQRMAGMDANACSSCHNEPVIGGAGGFAANVFVSEGFETADFDSIDPQFSNERNTNHLFGAGLVELLAREMTVELQAIRRAALAEARKSGEPVKKLLESKGVSFGHITALPDGMADLAGIEGVDSDLVIRPFSHKGVMTSLRQFTVNALNHHHGMQPDERFGARWTGSDDFDEDGKEREITDGDVSALVAWQATLEPPVRMVPQDPMWKEAAAMGEQVFTNIGCGTCHIPALPLDSLSFADPGPVDAAGTLRTGETAFGAVYDLALREWAATLPRDDKGRTLVPLFGDLKRHKMTDREIALLGNELLAQRFVERDVFQTTELWGVGSTGPYGHRGDFTTLDEIILAHGGDGRAARDAYAALDEDARDSLIAFLKTLVIPQ